MRSSTGSGVAAVLVGPRLARLGDRPGALSHRRPRRARPGHRCRGSRRRRRAPPRRRAAPPTPWPSPVRRPRPRRSGCSRPTPAMNPPLDMPVTSTRSGSTQNDDSTAAARSSKNSRSFTPSTPATARAERAPSHRRAQRVGEHQQRAVRRPRRARSRCRGLLLLVRPGAVEDVGERRRRRPGRTPPARTPCSSRVPPDDSMRGVHERCASTSGPARRSRRSPPARASSVVDGGRRRRSARRPSLAAVGARDARRQRDQRDGATAGAPPTRSSGGP